MTGLSRDKIDNLIPNPELSYEQIKVNWKYPVTSDFYIKVGSTEISGKEPPSNAEVYVKQYTDFILNEDGQKIPVEVTIKVW